MSLFEGVGASPNDNDEVKLQKALLVATSQTFAFLSFIWSGLYYYLGITGAALIPFGYAILSITSAVFFHKHRRMQFFRTSQILMVTFLPFILMYELGGFVNSGFVFLWGLLGPIGAMLFADYKKSKYWFVLYFGLLSGSIYVDFNKKNLATHDNDIIRLFISMNTIFISLTLLYLVYYFVDQKSKAMNLLTAVAEDQFSGLFDTVTVDQEIPRENVQSVLFLIINEYGVALYSHTFNDKDQFDEQLISGFITAINSFSKETFGSTIISQISYKDFHLLFDTLYDYKLVYAFRGNYKSAENNFNKLFKELREPRFIQLFPKNSNLEIANEELKQTILDILT